MGRLFAGDFHFIRRNLPQRLEGKVDRHQHDHRGGRGTAEGARPGRAGHHHPGVRRPLVRHERDGGCFRRAGQKRPEEMLPEDYMRLLYRLGWQPRVLRLQGTPRGEGGGLMLATPPILAGAERPSAARSAAPGWRCRWRSRAITCWTSCRTWTATRCSGLQPAAPRAERSRWPRSIRWPASSSSLFFARRSAQRGCCWPAAFLGIAPRPRQPAGDRRLDARRAAGRRARCVAPRHPAQRHPRRSGRSDSARRHRPAGLNVVAFGPAWSPPVPPVETGG